jgi:type VI secretion system Hcp family effector
MKRFLPVVMLVLGFVGAAAPEASAQLLQIYMKVDQIPGSSTDAKHMGWIEGVSLRQTLAPNGVTRHGCSIEVVKELDVAGPRLWAAAVMNEHIRDVTIELVTLKGRSAKVYEIRLDDVLILDMSTHGDNAFVERLTLVAGRVRLTYWPLRPDGSVGGEVETQWECYGEGPGPGLLESR